MNFTFRRMIAACLLATATVSLAQSASALTLSEFVDSRFRPWDRETAPGCAVRLIENGETLYENTYGMAHVELGVPITTDTVFDIGSNSKQFTVFAILLLEDEGLLSTDESVSEHWPEFPGFGHTITLDHLIGHTSGVRDYLSLMAFGGWNLLDDLVTDAQGLRLIERQRELNFAPGENWVYSNSGYMILAEIVARVSGMSFSDFVDERIFTPLGMDDSWFRDDHRRIVKRFAEGYAPMPERGYARMPISFASVGAGGMLTTLDDLARWDANFYDPLVGNQTILDKMHRIHRLNNGTPTGYGGGLIITEYNGRRLVYHGGDLGGYHANIVRFPEEEFTVITLANTFDLDSNTLLMKSLETADFHFANPSTGVPEFRMHEPLSARLGIQGSAFMAPDADLNRFFHDLYFPHESVTDEWPPLSVPQIAADDAQEYVGRYYSDELDAFISVHFDEDSENLQFEFQRFPPFSFTARRVRGDRIFFNETPELEGDFFRNEADEVAGFTIGNSRAFDMEYRRVVEIQTR